MMLRHWPGAIGATTAFLALGCSSGMGRSDESVDEKQGAADSIPGAQEPGPQPSGQAAERVSGRVVLTGSEPVVLVTLHVEGGSLILAGELEHELRRLSGVTLEVVGTRQGEGRMRMARFQVDQYEILEVDGEKPVVGTLLDGEAGFRVRNDEESVPLVGVSESLREWVGAKVWIVGQRLAEGLQVESYGIIREPETR